MDVWIDQQRGLPYRVDTDADLTFGAQSAHFTMNMTFTDYNGDVAIPAAPSDAKPFSQIASG